MKKTRILLLVIIFSLLIPRLLKAVPIRTDIDNPGFLSEYWKNIYGSRLKMKKIRRADLPKLYRVVRSFEKRYPSSLIKKTLKAIHVVRQYRVDNMSFSGTYFDNVIILKSNGPRYDHAYLVRILHHEYSSILMEYRPFPKKEWISISGKYGKYGDEDYFLKNSGNARNEKIEFFKKGFLTYYGTTAFVEDVNTYAEYVFMDKRHLDKIGKKFPRVKIKTKVFIQFYCGLDKKMNKYIDCSI